MRCKLTILFSAIVLSACYAVQRTAPTVVYYGPVPNPEIIFSSNKDINGDLIEGGYRAIDRKVPFSVTVNFPEDKDTHISIEVGSRNTTLWAKSPVVVDCSIARIEIDGEKFAPIRRQNVRPETNWYKWCDTKVTLYENKAEPEYLTTITFKPGKLLGESFHVVLPSIDGAKPIRVKYEKKTGVSISSGT